MTKNYNMPDRITPYLAKHKKRRSAPPPRKHQKRRSTPPPEPAPDTAPVETPPVDTSPSDAPIPPTEFPPEIPANAPISVGDWKSSLDQLYWLRIGLAVVGGVVATFAFDSFEGEARRLVSIIFMIILFAATIFVARSMNMRLPSSHRKKIVTQALPSYVLMYLFSWILSYTLVQLAGSGSITSPLT